LRIELDPQLVAPTEALAELADGDRLFAQGDLPASVRGKVEVVVAVPVVEEPMLEGGAASEQQDVALVAGAHAEPLGSALMELVADEVVDDDRDAKNLDAGGAGHAFCEV